MAKASSGEKGASGQKRGSRGMEFAVNKTRGLAFSRGDEGEEWEPIDMKEVTDLDEMERISHTKIGDNWFSIYRAGEGKS